MLNVRNLIAGCACAAVFLLVKPLEVPAARKKERKMDAPQPTPDSERPVQERRGFSSIGLDRGLRFFACEKEIAHGVVMVQAERAQGLLSDTEIDDRLLAMNAKAWYLMQVPVAGNA